MTMLPPPEWISDTPELQKLAGDLSKHSRFAVDTESNSLHAYREQLCLIQFSTPQNDFLVDALEFSEITTLAPSFESPKIEKVFHAAEYDLLCLKRSFAINVNNLFDTMQAARILGYKQVGLDAMLAEKLGVVLNKRYQKADWGERPLSDEMLNYARLDTHHLLDLRDCLYAELKSRGRWELAQEEFIRLAQGNGGPKNAVPSWQRVSGTQKFSRRQLAVLQELCSWREGQAEHMDRPVFKVIDDRRLVAIAQAAPRNLADLGTGGLTSRQIEMYGDHILQAIERGLKAVPLARTHVSRPKQAFIDRLNALSNWRKEAAKKVGIESDLILPKNWMHAIAEQNPQTMEDLAQLMPKSPWRISEFGEEILRSICHKK